MSDNTADWPAIWAAKVARAQEKTHMHLCGVPFVRLVYGEDRDNALPKCADCGVEHGMRHVEPCSFEVCPVCRGQMWFCGCPDDSDYDELDMGGDDEEEPAEV